VLSSSEGKAADARRLGAEDFVVTRDPRALARLAGQLDLLVDTVSARHDYNVYLALLRARGAMVLVGAPAEPSPFSPFSLILGNKKLAGSQIGGIAETQEMLDHCARHGIVSDIEPARRLTGGASDPATPSRRNRREGGRSPAPAIASRVIVPLRMKPLLLVFLVACAASSSKSPTLREQAAQDLACPAAELSVKQESAGMAEVVGCGRAATYHQGCNEYNTSSGCRWYKD
jgi:hypothetical protein